MTLMHVCILADSAYPDEMSPLSGYSLFANVPVYQYPECADPEGFVRGGPTLTTF